MAGRNKQPLKVLEGKGFSKHKTKKEAKKRAANEEKMRGNNDKVIAPDYLLKKQREEFEAIATELIELDIMSNLDVDTLARYIEAKTEYQRLGPVIRKLDPIKNIDAYTKLSRTRKQLSDECRSYASDLGLTITSRLKLVIPPSSSTVGVKTEAEKRFGGRL